MFKESVTRDYCFIISVTLSHYELPINRENNFSIDYFLEITCTTLCHNYVSIIIISTLTHSWIHSWCVDPINASAVIFKWTGGRVWHGGWETSRLIPALLIFLFRTRTWLAQRAQLFNPSLASVVKFILGYVSRLLYQCDYVITINSEIIECINYCDFLREKKHYRLRLSRKLSFYMAIKIIIWFALNCIELNSAMLCFIIAI